MVSMTHQELMHNLRLLLLIAAMAAACNDNRKLTIDDIVEKGEILDATAAKLEGKWSGFYQELDLKFDTVFYEKYEDKLEYLLSGTISDSSLVKGITLLDTFDVKPVQLEFMHSGTAVWAGTVKITFAGDSTVRLPFTLDLPANLSEDFLRIGFGVIDDSDTIEVWPLYELTSFESFDDAFLSGSFHLAILRIAEDSMRLALPGGYGKMVLGRSKHNARRLKL